MLKQRSLTFLYQGPIGRYQLLLPVTAPMLMDQVFKIKHLLDFFCWYRRTLSDFILMRKVKNRDWEVGSTQTQGATGPPLW